MSVRKKYSLLHKRHGSSRGGVVPQNLLGQMSSTVPIPIPVEPPKIQLGNMFVAKPLDIVNKKLQEHVKSCFHLPMNIYDLGLTRAPLASVEIAKIDYNGTAISLDLLGGLQICISRDEELLFFTRGDALIDKLVLPKLCIQNAVFSDDFLKAVLVFLKNFGFVYVSFRERAAPIHKFLERNYDGWIQGTLKTRPTAKIESMHESELRRRENSQRDPVPIKSPDDESDMQSPPLHFGRDPESGFSASDDVLRSGLPSLPKNAKLKPYSRRTRLTARHVEEGGLLMDDLGFSIERDTTLSEDDFNISIAHEEPPAEREIPASFDPPLHYTVGLDKKFIISYNDFKTLYNNDWVNDTLIDFFIAYEIDRAVNVLRLIHEKEVYAFNSFFFTKLFLKQEGQGKPAYYQNIQRWLAKVDLMSYNSVIIPINEHLHWYCAVIKNLPALLEYSRIKQSQAEVSDLTTEEAPPMPVKPTVTVHLIDSLKQNHTNLAAPLREVIKEYCKEKHGVDICTDLIRFKLARVQRQKNFNDCGVHVIFNIRKWLENLNVGEMSWKTHGKLKDNVFHGIERHGMRRACIDLLLDLHSKQPPPALLGESKTPEDAQSDDEVELISYMAPNGKNIEGTTEKDDKREEVGHTQVEEALGKIAELEKIENLDHNNDKVPHTPQNLSGNDRTEPTTFIPEERFGTELQPREKCSEQAESADKWEANISDILDIPNPEPALGQKPTPIPTPKNSPEKAISPIEDNATNDVFETKTRKTVEFTSERSDSKAEKNNHNFDSKADYLIDYDSNYKPGKKSHNRLDVKLEYRFDHRPDKKVDYTPKTPSTGKLNTTKYARTLDPRVIEQAETKRTGAFSNPEPRLVIAHPQIRRQFSGASLTKGTVRFLNEVFTDDVRRFPEPKLEKLKQLVAEYNELGSDRGSSHAQDIETKIREILKKPKVPMDQPLVIKDFDDDLPEIDRIAADADDSSGELNKSVGELTISSRAPERSSHEGTPEVTRQFLKQSEAGSLAYRSEIHRNTRARAKHAREYPANGLEIVDDSEDDEVELVSEISLILSSPSDRRGEVHLNSEARKTRESSRPRPLYVLNDYDDAISKMKIPKVSDSAEVYEVTEAENKKTSSNRKILQLQSHNLKRRRLEGSIKKKSRS